MYLLRGCEANILDETGKMDIPDGVLAKLEWVIASIHGILTRPMDEKRHTQLWCRIAENPHVDVIGHCGEETFRFDYEEGIRAFAAHKKIVEINAYSFISRPTSRKNCMEIARLCERYGVPLVVSSDAHFAGNVGNVQIALDHLKEAGIAESSILNTDTKRFAQYVSTMTGRTFNVEGE